MGSSVHVFKNNKRWTK